MVPNPFANVGFRGSKAVADGKEYSVAGDISITGGSDGFATEAMVITLKQPGFGVVACGALDDPGNAALRADYLTDGDTISEATVAPAVGEAVSPDFNGASPSPGPTAPTSIVWTRMTGPGWFQLNTCDSCMSYVGFYVENTTGKTLRVSAASASDDSEQILFDGKEVWIHNIPRGAGGARVQDRTPLLDLTPGKHLILQKVFEGCGGFDSALRLEDEDGNPLLLPMTLDPSADKPQVGDPEYAAGKAFVLRDIPDSLDVGETGKVLLKLRVAAALVDGVVEETVPDGFGISAVSAGGAQAGQKITWTIAGELSAQDLSYRVSVPEGSLDAPFVGTATLGGKSGSILGDQAFTRGVMNGAGFIKHWLVMGPLETAGLWPGDPLNPNANLEGTSATPENGDLHLDYISDGTVTEKTIRPFDGMRIAPAFNGDGLTGSKALGLEVLLRGCAPESPTWERFISPTGTFNNNDYFGADINSHATIAACYVTNRTTADIVANVAIHSDDAFIAMLDGSEIVAYEPGPCSATACGRGYGGEDTVANVAAVTITPGEHFLLTRVHDGFGGSGHRLRFQDDQGSAILADKLLVSTKSAATPPAVYVRRILSADSYRVGGDPLVVTLRVESQGPHDVAIKEVLPLGFSAGSASHGGVVGGGQVNWSLTGVMGTVNVTYELVAGDCPGGGSYCGNGPSASEYTVDGTRTHSLNGDNTFRRDTRGTDDLGAWDVRDVGTTGGATQRVGDRAVDVTGKGAGVKLQKDEFRFVSIPASGDFEIATKIECFDDPGGVGQGGPMVRDTMDTFGANVLYFMSSTPPAGGGVGTLKATFRRETNKTRTSSPITISDKDVLSFPIWLKLKREGGKISMYRSSDGVTYSGEIGSKDIGTGTTQVNLKAEALVGIATSGGGGGSTRVDYREVVGSANGGPLPPFTPEPPLAPTSVMAVSGGKDTMNVSWTKPGGPEPTAYVIYRASSPGGVYSQLAEVGATPTSYVDGGLAADTQYCYKLKSKRNATLSGDFSSETCGKTDPDKPLERFRRGDANGDGAMDLSDPIGVLGFQFLGGAAPLCFDAADVDDVGATLDLTDGIYSLQYQFLGGPAPPAPGPGVCGEDPTADAFPPCVYDPAKC